MNDRKPARFVKQYAQIGSEIQRALEAYASDVRSGTFPAEEHAYTIPDDELELFIAGAGEAGTGDVLEAAAKEREQAPQTDR